MRQSNSDYWMKAKLASAAWQRQEADKYFPRSDMVQEMELERARIDDLSKTDVVDLMRRGDG